MDLPEGAFAVQFADDVVLFARGRTPEEARARLRRGVVVFLARLRG